MNQLQVQVLAALSGELVGVPAQDVGLPVGSAAPDFTLPDLAGKSVALGRSEVRRKGGDGRAKDRGVTCLDAS